MAVVHMAEIRKDSLVAITYAVKIKQNIRKGRKLR